MPDFQFNKTTSKFTWPSFNNKTKPVEGQFGFIPKINGFEESNLPLGNMLSNSLEGNFRSKLSTLGDWKPTATPLIDKTVSEGIAPGATGGALLPKKPSSFNAENIFSGLTGLATGISDLTNIGNSNLNGAQKRMATADSALDTVGTVAANFGPIGAAIGGGLKLINSLGGALIGTPKIMKDFKVNDNLATSTGFTGTAGAANTLVDTSKSYQGAGLAGKLFGNRNKITSGIIANNNQQSQVSDIINQNKLAKDRAVASAGMFSTNNTMKLNSGNMWNNGSVQYGQLGTKLKPNTKLTIDTSLSDDENLANKAEGLIQSQSNWTRGYINSPMYKKRLQRQINTERNIIAKNYDAGLQSPNAKFMDNQTQLVGQNTGWTTNTIANNVIRHNNEQLTHLNNGNIKVGDFELDIIGAGGEFDRNINKINLPERYISGNRGGLVAAHELSHGINAGSRPYSNAFENKYIKGSVLKELGDSYIQDPTEVKARLDAIRFQMKKGGYYDAGTQEFNRSHLDKMKMDKNIINDINHTSLQGELNPKNKDASLIWLMNNIAKNKERQGLINYAKKGGIVYNPIKSEEIEEMEMTDVFPDKKNYDTKNTRLEELASVRKKLQAENERLQLDLEARQFAEEDNSRNAETEELIATKPASNPNKFQDFENRSLEILQALNPGKKVEVTYEKTGVYSPDGSRDWSTQADLKASGASKTGLSLHNFGAAKDYRLVIDGKTIDVGNLKLYKDVLHKAAKDVGLHTLGDWDVAHVGLAPEGGGQTWNYLKQYYPDIFESDRAKDTITKLKAGNQDKYLTQLGIFKEGGVLSNKNVIVHGALHAHKHSLKSIEGLTNAEITLKGVPIITKDSEGGILQHCEVETGEVVLHYECTQKLEELCKEGTDEAAIKAGKLLARELMRNTKDKTGTLRSIKNSTND